MKKLLSLLLFIYIIAASAANTNAETLNIQSPSYILMDNKTGQILYDFNSNTRLYPASTTKIMTAILALEKGNKDQLMTASREAVSDIGKDGMNIGIMPGETIRMEDLLNAMLIKSANETANIIAENLCPTRAEFVNLMNQRAKELGAVNTNFVNPCGKDSDKQDINHLTTASDLAKIAHYAMSLEGFRNIVSKKEYKMPVTNKHTIENWAQLTTSNKLFINQKFKSESYTTLGVKTGYTDKAGYNLVSAGVNNDGMELLAVVMCVKAYPSDSVFSFSKELLEYGFNNFSMQKIVSASQVVKSIDVIDAENGAKLDLVSADDAVCALPMNKSDWNITTKESITENVKAPVKAGDILGYVEYIRNGTVIGKVNVLAASSINRMPQIKIPVFLRETFGNSVFKRVIMICIIILASFACLRTVLRKLSRLYRLKRQENS